jgi:hypothetical protein
MSEVKSVLPESDPHYHPPGAGGEETVREVHA